jgi:hypothetical protein
MAQNADITAAEAYMGISVPSVFTDGALSVVPSPYVVKVTWGRSDPNLQVADGPMLGRAVLQTSLPLNSFVQTAVFFNNMVKRLVTLNLVTQAQVDEIAKTAGAQ